MATTQTAVIVTVWSTVVTGMFFIPISSLTSMENSAAEQQSSQIRLAETSTVVERIYARDTEFLGQVIESCQQELMASGDVIRAKIVPRHPDMVLLEMVDVSGESAMDRMSTIPPVGDEDLNALIGEQALQELSSGGDLAFRYVVEATRMTSGQSVTSVDFVTCTWKGAGPESSTAVPLFVKNTAEGDPLSEIASQ